MWTTETLTREEIDHLNVLARDHQAHTGLSVGESLRAAAYWFPLETVKWRSGRELLRAADGRLVTCCHDGPLRMTSTDEGAGFDDDIRWALEEDEAP